MDRNKPIPRSAAAPEIEWSHPKRPALSRDALAFWAGVILFIVGMVALAIDEEHTHPACPACVTVDP